MTKKLKKGETMTEIEAAFKEWALDHHKHFGAYPFTFIYEIDGVELELTEQWCQSQYEKHNFFE